MKSLSELLHRTPWWALILAAIATLAGLAFFVTPYHILQYRDDGKTVEETRAIKREIDNTFAENAISVGRNVLRGMIARTTDPERRAELEHALAGLEEARQELREAGSEILRNKRAMLEGARESSRNVREALRNAQREMETAFKDGGKHPEAVAAVKSLERSLKAAERAERDAERQLKRAARGTISVGPKVGDKPLVEIEIGTPTPPEPPASPAPDEAVGTPPQPPGTTAAIPPLPPLPPELASKIRRDVTGDMYRIGIGAALLLILVPLFIVAIVIKFFVDRSRAAQRVAELKRKEAEYHRMGQQVTEAKLAALQAQVEPHFLYNTLASVQALTEVDPARANEMTGHLIQYLRSALPKMRESVSTVGQEVDLVRAYLSILQMRMGPRLAFTISVPENLSAMPFPPLMLPSLVENAIKHGLEPQREGGVVHIAAELENGRLRLSVFDTGRGFSDTPGAGVGLANIRERLAALYGAAARLTLEANTPHGVVATIEVPAEGTRSGAGAATPGAAPETAGAPPPSPSQAPPPSEAIVPGAPAPAMGGFWPRAWEVLAKLERGWRVTLYYVYLVLVGVAAVAGVGLFIGAATGMLPVQIGDETFGGPGKVLVALAGVLVGFVAVSAALALVTLVIYGLGFFLFGLAIFVVCVVLVGLSPVLAPFILLALGIWWMARKRKAAQPGGERIEPTLAK